MRKVNTNLDLTAAAGLLEDLIGRAEAGDRSALLGLRATLALTPGLWQSHGPLTLRAERVFLALMARMRRARRRGHVHADDAKQD